MLTKNSCRPACRSFSMLLVCGFLIGLSASTPRCGELDVMITEVHFNVFRAGAEIDLEFVELQNRGPQKVDLSGWSFTEGLTYIFPAGTSIEPWGFVVIAANPEVADRVYGIESLGPFGGRLENNGESLVLANGAGHVINRIHYDDQAPWPSRPDGRGPSLEFIGRPTFLEHGANDQGRLWKPSKFLNGTPGQANSRLVDIGQLYPDPSPYLGGIINEVKPGGESFGFVELFNPLDVPLDLSGHFVLSSSYEVFFEIPDGTVLPPEGFVSFSDDQMNSPIPPTAQRYLLIADDLRTILDDLSVSPVDEMSFGRFPDGDGDAHILDAASAGTANEYTEDRSVLISEIYYHPPFVAANGECESRCSDASQWIELHNPNGVALSLEGWRLSSGVGFSFGDVSIPAEGYLIVCADVPTFEAEFPGVSNVVGGWSGRLNHSSDTIVLRNELGNPVDRVEYADGGPRNDEDPTDGEDDRTFRGSFWPREPDGDGFSLELIHPGLSNRAAVSWRSSQDLGGTPGAMNSRFDSSPAPSVRNLEHSPAVPVGGQDVVVTCRISSVANLESAELRWAVDGGGANGVEDLRDDGNGADAVAGDGNYSATIAGRNDDDVVRYWVDVSDSAGENARYPLEPEVAPYGGYPGAFHLFEVDDDAPDTSAPVYRIIMTENDEQRLGNRSVQSNVLLPATFVANNRAYHLVGVRYRGENSRNQDNRSYKVRFHAEEPFEGIDNLNLNAGNGGNFDTSGFREVVASDLFRRADVPYPMIWPIALHFPGEVDRDFDSRYIQKEAFDEEFLSRFFGGSDDGFLYRPRDPGGRPSGDLSFQGDDPDEYRDLYEKRTFEDEDDFSDIIELCRTFSPQQTNAEDFESGVGDLVDIRQWARFFAVMGCISNTDGGIWNNNGEDYFLYRMPLDSTRPNAGKWIMLPWDLEESFANADEDLFRSTVNSIERLFSIDDNARLYYDELRRVADGAFSRIQIRQRYDAASVMFDHDDVFNVVDAIDTNVTVRVGFIDSESSWALNQSALGTDESLGQTVIREGDDWRFFRGVEQPAGADAEWSELGYDDSDWELGPSGFGYDDGDDETVLNDMEDGYSTVFVRRIFQVSDPDQVVDLQLTVDYDDAFVAFLNGVEIARSDNAPDDEFIAFDMTATSNHEASGGGFRSQDPDVINLAARTALLREGDNVLALVGINGQIDSSDFSLIPTLSLAVQGDDGGGPAGGCGDILYAQGGTVILDGVCDPSHTRSISVGGETINIGLIQDDNGPWGGRWSVELPIGVGSTELIIRAHEEFDGLGNVVESRRVVVERVPQGFTNVEGGLDGDVLWTAAGGPYRMTDDVVVGANDTLEIEPGTVVLVEENASLIVRGELRAVGTQENPIRFMANRCGDDWGGIAFDDTGRGENDPQHELRFVKVSGGSSPGGFGGCIAVVDSKVLMADCEISEIRDNAIDASNAIIRVERTHIHDIFEGIHCTSSTARVLDCVIERMTGNSDAIDFDGSGDERSVIARCTMRHSSDDGIDLGNVSVDIRDNVLYDIQDKAISIEGPGEQGSPTLSGNLVFDSGSGMAIKNGINVEDGGHNTVANCQEGVQLFAKDEATQGGEASFHSMIVWNNGVDVFTDELSNVSFEFSNTAGGEFPGNGNISTDPLFTAAELGDYSLRPESPSLGTGRDGEDMGAIVSPVIPAGTFVRGDFDSDGALDITDAILALDYLFRGGAAPGQCLDIVDSNDDGLADLSDPIYVLRYLFAAGPVLPAPFPNPGVDPTEDALRCDP